MNEILAAMTSAIRTPLSLEVKTALLLKRERERYENAARLQMEAYVKEQIFQDVNHESIATYDPNSSQYCCMSCGERFFIKSNYEFHKEVKYIKIDFFCRLCFAPYVFYNRCKLISHMSTHASSTVSFKLSDIKISPYLEIETNSVLPGTILTDQTKLQSSSFLVAMNDTRNIHNETSSDLFTLDSHIINSSNLNLPSVSSIETVTSVENGILSLKNVSPDDSDNSKVPNVFTDSLIISDSNRISDANDVMLEIESNNCSECSIAFKPPNIKAERFIHFNKVNRPYSCKKCALNLPNTCALKSHLRMHFNTSPYVCPDCGVQFSHSSALIFHATFLCTHLIRKVYTNCVFPSCKEVCDFSKIRNHIKLTHFVRIHKCKLCVFASYVENDLKSHYDCVHPHTPYVGADIFHQCAICPPLISPLRLGQHLEQHVPTNGFVIFVCPGCNALSRRKCYFNSHRKNCVKYENHVALSKQSLKSLGKHLNSNSEFVSNLHSEYASNSTFSDSFHNTKSLHKANMADRVYDPSKFQCYICKLTIGTDFQSISSHFSLHHKEIVFMDIKIILNRLEEKCNLLTEQTSSGSKKDIQNGGNDKYNDDSVNDIYQKDDIIYKTYQKDDSITKNYQSDMLVPVSLNSKSKKRRRTKEKRASNELDRPFANGILISQDNGTKTGLFSCSNCVFNTSEKQEFHKHIITHRVVSTAYQCMECGSSYSVKPSFATHLFVSHQINNMEEYIANNNCIDKKAVEQFEEDLTLPTHDRNNLSVGELQCHICLENCNNQSDFDKHFRVHGMAFLKKKQKK